MLSVTKYASPANAVAAEWEGPPTDRQPSQEQIRRTPLSQAGRASPPFQEVPHGQLVTGDLDEGRLRPINCQWRRPAAPRQACVATRPGRSRRRADY
jgi:hypothetical protein